MALGNEPRPPSIEAFDWANLGPLYARITTDPFAQKHKEAMLAYLKELRSYRVQDLRGDARFLGIPSASSMNKDQLVQALAVVHLDAIEQAARDLPSHRAPEHPFKHAQPSTPAARLPSAPKQEPPALHDHWVRHFLEKFPWATALNTATAVVNFAKAVLPAAAEDA
jgi:hypothetical protein